MRCVFVAALLCLITLPVSATEPLWKRVGSWDIRVDRSLNYGCFLVNVYQGGTVFRIGFDRTNGGGYLMLGNPNWRSIEVGKEYDLEL